MRREKGDRWKRAAKNQGQDSTRNGGARYREDLMICMTVSSWQRRAWGWEPWKVGGWEGQLARNSSTPPSRSAIKGRSFPLSSVWLVRVAEAASLALPTLQVRRCSVDTCDTRSPRIDIHYIVAEDRPTAAVLSSSPTPDILKTTTYSLLPAALSAHLLGRLHPF